MLNEEDSRLKVNISAGQNAGFQMKTHPNIDKALYSSQSVLGLKDPQKPFPAGSPLGILKWRMQVLPELYIPAVLNSIQQIRPQPCINSIIVALLLMKLQCCLIQHLHLFNGLLQL